MWILLGVQNSIVDLIIIDRLCALVLKNNLVTVLVAVLQFLFLQKGGIFMLAYLIRMVIVSKAELIC